MPVSKMITIYFAGLDKTNLPFSTHDNRKIYILGLIELAKDIDAFVSMIIKNKSFGIVHYDRAKNIVTFENGNQSYAVILPFLKDDIYQDVDKVFCCISTRDKVTNSRGELIEVECILKLDHDYFESIFSKQEKGIFPVEFLEGVKNMYSHVTNNQELDVESVETIEKFIDERDLSVKLIKKMVKKPVPPPNFDDFYALMQSLNEKLDRILNHDKNNVPENKTEHISLLFQE